MTREELAWMAGLFEGEGCFTMHTHHILRMEVSMTDRDVVERFAMLAGFGKVNLNRRRGDRLQDQWRWSSAGRSAEELALLLRPLMGERRRARIDAIMAERAAYVAEATRERRCLRCGITFSPPFNAGASRKDYCTKACAWPQERHTPYKKAWRAERRAKGLPVT